MYMKADFTNSIIVIIDRIHTSCMGGKLEVHA